MTTYTSAYDDQEEFENFLKWESIHFSNKNEN